jgi:hypothetical protein
MNQLNPCAKCGSTNIAGPYMPQYFDLYSVKCRECKQAVDAYWKPDAVSKWNEQNPLPAMEGKDE